MNAHKGLNILNVLAGILIIVGVNTFAHICTMMEGPCAKTKTLAIAVAAVLAVLGIAQFALSNKNINAILGVVSLLVGITTVLLPLVIAPTCQMPSMHCYVYTRPFLVIVGVVVALISLADILVTLKKR
ncbi:protein of unknown function [Oscillospiraceae bacterium]|nr:protein of unknown function [Oscillospiraceae bacterium]